MAYKRNTSPAPGKRSVLHRFPQERPGPEAPPHFQRYAHDANLGRATNPIERPSPNFYHHFLGDKTVTWRMAQLLEPVIQLIRSRGQSRVSAV